MRNLATKAAKEFARLARPVMGETDARAAGATLRHLVEACRESKAAMTEAANVRNAAVREIRAAEAALASHLNRRDRRSLSALVQRVERETDPNRGH